MSAPIMSPIEFYLWKVEIDRTSDFNQYRLSYHFNSFKLVRNVFTLKMVLYS